MKKRKIRTVRIKNLSDDSGVDMKFLERTAAEAMAGENMQGELSVLLSNNGFIRELNRKYLSTDRPTDVLAFPMGGGGLIGDVVISVEKAAEQAEEYGQEFKTELARLLVHGILHIAGYRDGKPGERRKMELRQEELLKKAMET